MNTNWISLQERFRDIVIKAGGPGKSSSGNITVEYGFDGDISVVLGTYDIGSWSRTTILGPFSSEKLALNATTEKLDEAEKLVNLEACLYSKLSEGLLNDSDESDEDFENTEDSPFFEEGFDEAPVEKLDALREKVSLTMQITHDCQCPNSQKCGKRFSYGLE